MNALPRLKALGRRAEALPAWTWGIVPALVCLVTGLTDRLYTDIDNFYVSIVTNGLYGSPYCQYTHPLLGLLIGNLARIWPQADWFALLTRIFITLSVWWFCVLLAKCVPFGARRVGLWFLLILFLLRNTLYNTNYTIPAAMFAALGVLTLLLALRTPLGCGTPWIIALFVSLGILWRAKGAVLIVPFAALALAVWLFFASPIGTRRARFKRLLSLTWPALLCIAALLAGFSAFYAAEPYSTSKAYDNARISLRDFPAQPWGEVKDELEPVGISENDYLCIIGGVLMDTEILTPDKLLLADEANGAQRFSLSPRAFRTAFSDLRSVLAESPLLQWCLLLGVLAAAAVLFSPCRWYTRLEIVLACGGAGLIILYFSLLGRTRDRVVISVLFGLLTVCLPPLLSAPVRGGKMRQWLRRGVCALLAVVCALLIVRRSYGGVQLACTARVQEPTTAAEADDDTVYVWNSMLLALQMTEQYMQPGKLPDEAFLQHNIPYGEWVSGQSYFNEMLAEIDLPNPICALIDRPNTRLVAADIELLETFLQEHYGSTITLQQVGTMEVFAVGETPIWQVVK